MDEDASDAKPNWFRLSKDLRGVASVGIMDCQFTQKHKDVCRNQGQLLSVSGCLARGVSSICSCSCTCTCSCSCSCTCACSWSCTAVSDIPFTCSSVCVVASTKTNKRWKVSIQTNVKSTHFSTSTQEDRRSETGSRQASFYSRTASLLPTRHCLWRSVVLHACVAFVALVCSVTCQVLPFGGYFWDAPVACFTG